MVEKLSRFLLKKIISRKFKFRTIYAINGSTFSSFSMTADNSKQFSLLLFIFDL